MCQVVPNTRNDNCGKKNLSMLCSNSKIFLIRMILFRGSSMIFRGNSEILCPEVLLFPRWLCSGVSALGLDPRASGCLRTSGWEIEIKNLSSLVLSQPWPWTHSSGVWTSSNVNASVLMVFIPYQELRTRRENFLLFLPLVSTASFSSKIATWNF